MLCFVAAARQFGLDFIPLAQERYVMACHKQALNDPKFQEFLNIIRGEEFNQAVAQLPGYNGENCGCIKNIEDVFNNQGL